MFLVKSYCDIGNSQSSSSIVAPDGEITTTFEYDGIQRLGRVTDTGDNVTPPFTYDPLGNVLTKQTANMAEKGKMIAYTYDYHRLTGINYPHYQENNVKYYITV